MASFEVLYPAAAVVDGKVISFTSGVVELPAAAAKPLVDSGHLKSVGGDAPKPKADGEK
jgi:hypothetical protein